MRSKKNADAFKKNADAFKENADGLENLLGLLLYVLLKLFSIYT